jgi:glucans biosynthesis protein
MFWEMGVADIERSENMAVSTRVGPDTYFQNSWQFVIDFTGPKLDAIPENAPPAVIASSSTNAVIMDDHNIFRNPYLNSWRVILKMQPKPGNTGPVDLRCTLQRGTNVVSETWVYQWNPP